MKRQADKAKSEKVKKERGASPEEIVVDGSLISIEENKNYPNQLLEIYLFQDYVWVVVSQKEPPKLITAYKSRKHKRKYAK